MTQKPKQPPVKAKPKIAAKTGLTLVIRYDLDAVKANSDPRQRNRLEYVIAASLKAMAGGLLANGLPAYTDDARAMYAGPKKIGYYRVAVPSLTKASQSQAKSETSGDKSNPSPDLNKVRKR